MNSRRANADISHSKLTPRLRASRKKQIASLIKSLTIGGEITDEISG